MDGETSVVLNEIGTILAKDTDYPLDGTFLFVEMWPGVVDISIFKDLGDRLLCRIPMDGLDNIIYDWWCSVSPNKRWSTMEYRITDGKFDASFTYDEPDPEMPSFKRRDAVLQQRYGNKQVIYPPPPNGLAPYTP